VSDSLSKNNFNIIFKNDKFIFKSGMFIEKWYLCDRLFKMNVMIIAINDGNNNKIASSSDLLKYCDVWHYRLSHVNYNSIQRLINHELLPSMVFKKNHKCRICVESKFSKPLF
jgi:hypothetical protein